ncbi:hypothetical protein [Rhodoferax sp.]|uniref:hypothetical protein n=1 Tax=Rhodoferax sp. TaxID=50421 RepID=UPI00262A3869|nr:hypothetical protein [Rhodoferax sp.]MDD2927060.1 hypothetical protein [Rhodoferax sp.]
MLTTTTFDPLGVVTLDCVPEQTLGETRRRMSRVATLDGGAVFNDGGYSEADRTIQLRWVPKSAEQEAAVARLVERYARLQVSTRRGVFLAATEAYAPGATESSLSLLVVEKLSV